MTSRQLILGTAGHIDHGKTALVRALTGIDTDRLPQEKQRGITIDIGFADLDLGEVRLGIVDVPGHERFIKNMLAGATGIDVAMLVVAADDSVMPQTREHLAILQLLEVKHGLIVLTKTDLVQASWLELVEEEVRELVSGTFLEDAPILCTSATEATGVSELKTALADVCARVELKSSESVFRLAVDRSFVVQGLGTIVTGTVWSGELSTGEDVEWLPLGRTIRVRGLESHGHTVERVRRGQRAAINLMGAHHTEIGRGHEIAAPGYMRPSRLLTVRVTVLDESPWPIKHRARLRLHVGTQEVMVTVSLLEGTKVSAGETAYAQLTCAEPTMAVGGQPFVLRAESPLVTVGGGHVLQSVARRISRRDRNAIQRLEQRRSDDPVIRAAATIYAYGADDWTHLDVCRDAKISSDRVKELVEQIEAEGVLVELSLSPHRKGCLHRDVLKDLENRVFATLRQLHDASRIDPLVPRSSLGQRLDYLNHELLDGIISRLISDSRLVGDDRAVGLAEFKPKLTGAQRRLREHVIEAYKSTGLSPPVPADLIKATEATDADVSSILGLCASQGHLIHLGGTLYLNKDWEAELRQRVAKRLCEIDKLTMSELRDLLGTTRKFAVPIGEYLDRIGLTKRVGDVRVLADASLGKAVG